MYKKSTQRNPNKVRPYNNPNLYGMIQNITIASLNKGQFIAMWAGLIITILVIKMPSADTTPLLHEILHELVTLHLLGWFISFVLVILWYSNNRSNRKIHHDEMDRVTKVRTDLQENRLEEQLDSSNDPH